MRFVAVLPYVLEEFKDRCLDRCMLDNVLLVDNRRTNLGIMRSHNLGIDAMRELDADWLIVMSAAIRFGGRGGRDFTEALERMAGVAVVNAEGLFGWHLMAFSRATIEAAGRWDENFSPYGWDDCDYAIRVHKAQPGVPWEGVKVDVIDTIMAHSIKLAGVKVDNGHHMEYFETKWGLLPGPPFPEFHDNPWGNPALDVRYWPPHGDGRWDEAAPKTEQATWR